MSTSTCRFPGCTRPVATTVGPGAPSAYCDDTGHTPGRAYRARKAEPDAAAENLDRPVTSAGGRAGSLRDELLKIAADLGDRLDRATIELTAMTDPVATAGEIAALTAETAERVAVAEAARSRAETAELAAVALRVEAVAAAEEAVEEIATANDVHDADVQSLTSTREELAAAVANVEALTADLARVTTELDDEKVRAAGLDQDLTQTTGDLAEARTALTRLQTQIEHATAQVTEVMARAAAAEAARAKADQARHDADTRAAVAEAAATASNLTVDGLKEERVALTGKLEAAIGRASAAETRAAGLTERVAELQKAGSTKSADGRRGTTQS